MMRKWFYVTIAFALMLNYGCAQKKSAIDQLKGSDKNPIEALQFPEPSPSTSGLKGDSTQFTNPTNKIEDASLKKSRLKRKTILDKKLSTKTKTPKRYFDPTPPLPEELIKVKDITLNFENTDVYEVITIICELLQINYLIEGDVQGKITLQTFQKVPAKHLYSILEQILAVSGITVAKSGNFYRFIQTKEAPQKPINLYYGNDSSIPSDDRVIIQLIPLINLEPNAIKPAITPLVSKHGTLLELPDSNVLVLIDLASNARQILQVVEALDTQQVTTSDLQLYNIFHSEAETIVEELNNIFGSIGYKSALDKSLKFLPLTRINSILVINSVKEVNERIEFWIEKLDQPIAEGKLSTFVYYIQNGEAGNLASLLQSIFKEKDSSPSANIKTPKTPKTGNSTKPNSAGSKAPGSDKKVKVDGGIDSNFTGPVDFIPDKDTNALIVRTETKNYPAILEIIQKLDLLPQQVLIEVLIMDLTLDDQTRTGIEWAMRGTLGNRPDGNEPVVGGGSAPATSTLGSQIGNTATSLFAPGASFFVHQKDKFIGLLQAFASDSKINIVANPILITSDNKEASISIVDDIPIQSSTISTPTAGQPLTQTTIEFRSVGVKLGILPKINSDNFVNLKIDQEISNLGPVFQNTPSFTTRTMKTEVVLKDNQILVMGGLMRTTTTDSIEGIPLLKDIPYFGKLFSSQSQSVNKTELMLFIVPHIISNTEDSQYVTQQFKNKIRGLEYQIFAPTKKKAPYPPIQ